MGGQAPADVSDKKEKKKTKGGLRAVTPTNLHSVVVDGCEYIVEQHTPQQKQQQQKQLVFTNVDAPLKTPSDCSSSSGVELRMETHSDASSSYASSRSALSRSSKTHNARKKNVTFSDKVALVSTAPAEVATDAPQDYMAYVQALLKRSPGKRSCDSDVTRRATPTLDAPVSKSNNDSDFDEETDDSSSDDVTRAGGDAVAMTGASDDRVQCNLCRKRLIDATQVFCDNCSHYMSQFEPAQVQ